MADTNDLQSPLIDVEQQNDDNNNNNDNNDNIKSARNIAKYFRFTVVVVIVGLIIWYSYHAYKMLDPNQGQNRSTTRTHQHINETNNDANFKVSGNKYIKYFAKNGENPMHCVGAYCWSIQTPDKVVCSIENNAKPWNSNAAWMCEAMCPEYYDLDTVKITCSSDHAVATNPHLGCSLEYSMKYTGYIPDWNKLKPYATLIFWCIVSLSILICCIAVAPPSESHSYRPQSSSRNNGPDACDILICLVLLDACCNKKNHSSRTWG